MAHKKRWLSGTLAVVVTGALLSVPDGAAAVTGPATGAGGSGTALGTVTLLTGDEVTLYDDSTVSVTPGPGREDIHFTSYQQQGRVYALPADAMALVGGGSLDPELFNVSTLVKIDGDGLPLLVSEPDDVAARSAVRSGLSAAGAQVTRELPAAEAVAVRAEPDDLPALWEELSESLPEVDDTRSQSSFGVAGAGDTQVWLDRPMELTLADSVPQVGAPDAWAAGFDGTGVTVAVLDSGVDATHPDLAGAFVDSENFTDEPDADLVGHGTHVASTIVGDGTASGGTNQGVAHGASLLSAKVCERTGCNMSDIIDGMQWAVDEGADVVNISLGGLDFGGVDPLEAAVNNLTASDDVLFVVSAGNNFGTRSLNSPSTADAALAVGAVDGSDVLADFSSWGPRIDDSTLKPDITAPGVDVTAARSQDSPLGGTDYTTLDGTSMAAPHVAGAAAILAQKEPGWSPELLKSALMGSAIPTPDVSAFAQGAGRLEVPAAIDQEVTVAPASVSLGLVTHDPAPGETVDETVTYHNHGSSAVTLSLAMDTSGPEGNPAPAGMFSLSSASVVVPAGGDASVTLTAALDLPSAPTGQYTGRITATGGGVEVTTPFGIERAVKLSIDHTGRTGGDPISYGMVLGQVDGPMVFSFAFSFVDDPGVVDVWVARGTYVTQSFVTDVGPGGADTSVLSIPLLEAETHQSIHVDAQVAQPVDVTVPDPAAVRDATAVGSSLLHEGRLFSVIANVVSNPYTGAVGPPSFVPGFRAQITTNHYVPGPGGDSQNTPAVYRAGWVFDNDMPTGFSRTLTAGDFAEVELDVAAYVPNGLGRIGARFQPPDRNFGSGLFVNQLMDLPGTRTEYYNTEGSILWRTLMAEFKNGSTTAENNVLQRTSGYVEYTAGTSQVQQWNRPVYGPGFDNPTDPLRWAGRIGNTVAFMLPLASDGDGYAGFPRDVDGQVTLTHNGQTFYDEPYNSFTTFNVTVPPAFGTYELVATAQRDAPAELSTELEVEWTFQSSNVGGSFPVRLPLWSVRMSPALDASNTAPAGQVFEIPVLASPQAGSSASGLDDLTVEYSVDDGVTWQPATVSPDPGGDGHIAEVTHPNITGFVSLRAFADDFSGSSVEQEVIRAYKIAP